MPAPRYPDHPRHLARLRQAALQAADPGRRVRQFLRLRPGGLAAGDRLLPLPDDAACYLVALGKASPAMARAAADLLGSRLTAGVAAVPRGVPLDLPPTIEAIPAGHPLPDEGSLAAGKAVSRLLSHTRRQDLAVVLVSGGGSAMLELPRPGVELADLRAVNDLLLRSGAPIHEINLVRQALSQIKAGGLERLAAPARVLGLILSDVVGDRLSAVASGPTVLRYARPQRARAVLEAYGLWSRVPPAVQRALSGEQKPLPPARRPVNLLIGSNREVVRAVAAEARRLGFEARVLTTRMQGEARLVGERFATRLLRAQPPACLLMGGETTVTVRGGGKGGRNQELALTAALHLEGAAGVAVMSLATDGVDGPTDAAGAVVTGETVPRARALGLDPEAALADNDAYPLLEAVGALLRTGPTGTNLNDVVIGLRYR